MAYITVGCGVNTGNRCFRHHDLIASQSSTPVLGGSAGFSALRFAPRKTRETRAHQVAIAGNRFNSDSLVKPELHYRKDYIASNMISRPSMMWW